MSCKELTIDAPGHISYTFPMKSKYLSILALISVSLFGYTAPVSIVEWGQATDIVSGHQNLTGGGSTSLNLSTLRNPTVGTSYYNNNTGKTPEFYGAFSGATPKVRNDGGGDNIGINANGITYCEMVVVWTQDYFMNDGDTATDIELEGMSSRITDNGGSNTTTSRFVIRLDDTFYASASVSEGNNSFADPSTMTWVNYDPVTDMADFTGGTATLTDFSNLTAVGYYANSTRASAGTMLVEGVSFSATASVIPEPSSIVLLFGSMVLGVFLLRRR